LFGLFATVGMIFLHSEGGRSNRTRLIRENTLDSGEEDFYGSLAAERRHWQDWDGQITFAEKFNPRQVARQRKSGKWKWLEKD